MKKVMKYLSKSIKEVILGPLFKMLEVIFELCVPLIVSSIIDVGIPHNDIIYILLMCGVLLIFAALGLISSVVAQYFSAVAANKLATNIRNDLFQKIQNLKYKDLDDIGYSTLITRMTSDVNNTQTGVNMTLRLLLRSPVVVIGAIAVSFFISIEVGYIFLCTVPTLFIIVFFIMFFSIPLFNKSQNKLDDVVELTQENLVGSRVIRAFNQQEDEKNKYHHKTNELRKSQLSAGRLSLLINPLTYALINIFIILLLYQSGIQVNLGNLTKGNVVALYNLISQILVETIKFANLIIIISKAISSSNRIEEIFSLESELIKHDHKNGNEEYIVEFDNVSMSYQNNDKYVLNNISFKVKKGESVGIIGGTGSGKTTLINILMHFYDIQKGTIYFNGKDIASIDVIDNISLVPQKNVLFSGTIKDNLLWGNNSATEEEIYNALKVSQALEIVNKKEKGLLEEVEQNGSNFSGGQKQRLCIARALVKKCDILILDDSTSALDFITDSLLRKSLKEFNQDLTVFMISQRTASLMHCDKILVLDKGNLVGIGNHSELLENCEVYKEIYLSQFEVKHE